MISNKYFSLISSMKKAVDVPLLLDTYSGASAAYSLRKLRTAYTGNALTVRRSSDNTSQDIGFDVNGNLDTTSLLSFVGAGNGFVTIWYNQDGNTNHYVYNTTAAQQPQIVENGSVLVDSNGKPQLRFTNQLLRSVAGFGWNVNTSALFYVGNSNGVSVSFAGLITMSNATYNPELRFGIGVTGNSDISSYWNNNYQISGPYNLQLRKVYSSIITGNKTQTVYGNGIQLVTVTNTGTFNNLTEFTIGGYLATNGFQNGFISEVIVYTSNQSFNRTGIESNINSFYSIY